MENREAIRKIKFMRDAYQKLIDENVDEGRLVGTDVTGTWKADTPLNEVYRKHIDALDLAISALEKQIPKKPKHIDKNATFDGNWKKVCPACGRVLVERITTPEESYPEIYNHTPHCICGQAIDWEEE